MASTKPDIAQLVERMPATDKEKEAQKAPPPVQTAEPAKPKTDKPVGSKFDAPDPEVMDKICREILAGGRASLLELVRLIRDPAGDDFKNYKAEYLCHCLTIFVGRPDQAASRRLVIDTLASQVVDDKLAPHTRGFLARELQFIGDKEAVPALGRLLADERFCDDAARALLAIQEDAAAEFRRALPATTGRRRLVVLQSLGALRDASSANAFLEAVGAPDREIRLAGVWGLARIGSAASTAVLLKAAETKEPWERIKATQACLLLAENLVAANQKAEALRIYTHLRDTRTSPRELYIRDLAAKALDELQSGKKLT